MAWLRMSAVSSISTLKVDLSCMMASAAPMRVMMRSTGVRRHEMAGTQQPTWARIARQHALRSNVDLPPGEEGIKQKGTGTRTQLRCRADRGNLLQLSQPFLLA